MTRALVSELATDARTAKLPAAVSIGLVMTLLVVAVQTSIASIIFAGPLSPHVALGTGAALAGASALCLVTALFGSYPGTISLPQFPVAAGLVAISTTLGIRMEAASSEEMAATMMAILVCSTTATGLCFSLIGWFRLSNFLRFMPYPLVGGFLAGLGWVLSLSGIKMASGIGLSWHTLPQFIEADALWRWGPCVAYAVLLFAVTRRWSHYLIVPGSILLGIVLYRVALFMLDIPDEAARSAGILFVGLSGGYHWPSLGPDLLAQVDWWTVASQVPGVLSLVLIALMAIVMNGGALELGTGRDIDMNREFRAEGAACLVAGLGPSVPGCNVVQMSLLSRAVKAETRFTGIVVACGLFGVLVFGGGLLGLLPMPILGGLVLFMGFGLIRDWVFTIRKSIPATDYAVVLIVSVVIGGFGFVQGVAVGLVIAVVIFVVHFSHVDVIGTSFAGSERQSTRRRSAVHRALLREQGRRVRVYRLKGFVIFGNVSPLGERVSDALRQKPSPLCLVLDFTGVSGFDVSAANVISRCIRAASAQGTQVVISSISGRARGIVERILGEDEWERLVFTDDLDSALEHCEDLVIAEWNESHADKEQERDALFSSSINEAMRQVETHARFEDLVDRLKPRLRECRFAEGEVIVAQGEMGEGMHLFVEGRATAKMAETGVRVDEFGPGDILMPQSSIGPCTAPITVVASEQCRTLVMNPEARLSLERDHPKLALELDRYVIEGIAKQTDGQSPRERIEQHDSEQDVSVG